MKNMKNPKRNEFSCFSCFSLFESPKSGGILVFMLVVTATLTMLALFAGSMASNRARLASDAVLRSTLRDEAFDAVAQTVALINTDTNGVDHFSEPWAQPFRIGRVEMSITDEKSRLHFPSASRRAFASLLGDDEAAAAFVAWRDGHTNRVWKAEEELFEFITDTRIHDPVRPHFGNLTAHGDGRGNVNTLPREVFFAFAASAGVSAETAARVFARLEEARTRGDWFASLDLAEVSRVLAAGGIASVPTAELMALNALLPVLCVESGLFRITARATDGRVSQTIQCVCERGTGRILRWVEY